MTRLPSCLILLSLLTGTTVAAPPPESRERRTQALPATTTAPDRHERRPPVVLLHGLTNKHPWSEPFLEACLDAWGDGRVFLVYTNKSARSRAVVTSRKVGRRTVIVGGIDDATAGDTSVASQSAFLEQTVARLQASHGLDPRFSIVAHSMGGLVARHFVDTRPGVVTGLVTLGTPHHGSPLADDFAWAGLFMGATDAIADLAPERCAAFNRSHPAAAASFAPGGRLFTIEGDGDRTDSFGAYGELALGWTILFERHATDSDGLVPRGNAHLEGAVRLTEFPDDDHYELVRDPAVAREAAEALP